MGTDRLFHRRDVAERHLVEAVQRRTETLEILRRAGRGQGRQRAAMERAFESDDPIALRMPLHGVIAARHLDAALHRLGAGIAEEYLVGEALFAEPRGETLAVRALEQIRHVPQPGGLLLQRRHQMGMGVAECVDGDAAGEVEITLAVGADQPDAFAALERNVGPGENWQQMRRRALGHDQVRSNNRGTGRTGAAQTTSGGGKNPVPKTKCAAFPGGTCDYSRTGLIAVNLTGRVQRGFSMRSPRPATADGDATKSRRVAEKTDFVD